MATRRASVQGALNHKYYTKVIKKLDELWRLSCNPDFNLPRSAPNIVQILSDILKKLNLIQSNHPGPQMNEIFTNEYMNFFVKSLEENIKSLKAQLSENKAEVARLQTPARQKVITSIVHFTYLHKELNHFFPDGTYNKMALIQGIEAKNWWRNHFNESVLIPVSDFVEQFCNSFNIVGALKRRKLMDEINFCKTNYITIFQFELFCKLFSPWINLIRMWEALTVDHSGYLSYATYDDVTAYLDKFRSRPGSYVFRMSCTSLGYWSIGFVREDGNVAQTVVKMKSIVEALVDGKEKSVYKYPGGKMDNPDLHYLLPTTATILVTEDKAGEYGALDMSFELCKICVERDKDMKIDPCGHLICSDCLKNWTSKNRGDANCPFCRTVIASSTKIVLNKSPATPVEAQPNVYKRDRQSLSRESIGSSGGTLPPAPVRKDSVSSALNADDSYMNSGCMPLERPNSEFATVGHTRFSTSDALTAAGRPLPRPPSEDITSSSPFDPRTSRKPSFPRTPQLPTLPADEYDMPKIDANSHPRTLPPIPIEDEDPSPSPLAITGPVASPSPLVPPASAGASSASVNSPAAAVSADYAYFNGSVDARPEDDYASPGEDATEAELRLVEQGFPASRVKDALKVSKGNQEMALNILKTFVTPDS